MFRFLTIFYVTLVKCDPNNTLAVGFANFQTIFCTTPKLGHKQHFGCCQLYYLMPIK